MTNKLTKFSSPDLGISLSGMLLEGKPVILAVEMAKSLGYTNPAKALQDHCKSLIKLNYNDSLELGLGENPRGVQLAGQADVFRLIMRSNLPSAEQLQDWVCEDVLPSIFQTGSYGTQQSAPISSVEHQPVTSMNNDILSLARVVAEATASATMKAVIDVVGIQKYQPIVEPVAVIAPPAPEALQVSHHSPDSEQSEYALVSDLSWACGLSDAACRRLATFANLPTCMTNGDRGHLLIHRDLFMTVAQTLLDESTPPTGKLKRWQHPEFGGFTLRLKSEKHTGETK
ncbi:BRO-N domain-containing protein [Yersinia rohdei]|uniref:BRO-N domain-containing protein n=1 Tax=Yersinia rohdei TaxID=29485 RepID=UPI00119EA825